MKRISDGERAINYANAFEMYCYDAKKFKCEGGEKKELFFETSTILVDKTLPAILKNTETYERGLQTIKKVDKILSPVTWGGLIIGIFYPIIGYPIWTTAMVSRICCILKAFTGHEKLHKAEDKTLRIGQELSNLGFSPKYIADLMKVNNIEKTVDPFGYVELVYKGKKKQLGLNSPVDALAEKGIDAIHQRGEDEWEF